jgi:hypothetical protein
MVTGELKLDIEETVTESTVTVFGATVSAAWAPRANWAYFAGVNCTAR